MKRHSVDKELVSVLRLVTDKRIGYGKIPEAVDELPELPYAIVYPLRVSAGVGGMDDGEDSHEFDYQIKCVGESHEQAAWMSSLIHNALMDRTGGQYTNELSPSGSAVAWRVAQSKGAIVPSGTSLFQCDDTYTLRIDHE